MFLFLCIFLGCVLELCCFLSVCMILVIFFVFSDVFLSGGLALLCFRLLLFCFVCVFFMMLLTHVYNWAAKSDVSTTSSNIFHLSLLN